MLGYYKITSLVVAQRPSKCEHDHQTHHSRARGRHFSDVEVLETPEIRSRQFNRTLRVTSGVGVLAVVKRDEPFVTFSV